MTGFRNNKYEYDYGEIWGDICIVFPTHVYKVLLSKINDNKDKYVYLTYDYASI